MFFIEKQIHIEITKRKFAVWKFSVWLYHMRQCVSLLVLLARSYNLFFVYLRGKQVPYVPSYLTNCTLVHDL